MRKFWAYLALATLVGVVFLWLAARELPWDEVGTWAAGVDPAHLSLWSLVFILTFGVSHAARLLRWNELVQPLGDADPATVNRVCAVGFAAILLLPLRLGELVRPYLLARRSNHSMSALLGTVVVERVVDGLVITGLLFATLATYRGSHSAEFAHAAGALSAAVFVPALLVSLFALWTREPTLRLLRNIGNRVSARLTARVLALLEAFIDGIGALARAHALLRFALATAVYWATNIASMWLLARYGFGFELSFWDTATVLAVLVIGVMIPAGPGMAGNFEFFALRGLALFVAIEGVDAVAAAAFAALVHILQFVVITLPGFVVMWTDPQARHLVRISTDAASDADGLPTQNS